jgi:hypothetical protein
MLHYKTGIAYSCSLRLHIYENLWFFFRLCRKKNYISPILRAKRAKAAFIVVFIRFYNLSIYKISFHSFKIKIMKQILIRFLLCITVLLFNFSLAAQCPRSLKAFNVTKNTATITWIAGSIFSSSEILAYREYTTDALKPDWTTIPRAKSPTNISNLKSETLYEFKVINSVCNATTNLPRFKTLAECQKATNIAFNNISGTSATISWTPGAGNNGEVLYILGVSKEGIGFGGDASYAPDLYTDDDNGNKYLDYQKIYPNIARSPMTLTDLKPNFQYFVQVISFCNDINPFVTAPKDLKAVRSDQVSFYTKAQANCVTPILRVSNVRYNSIYLTWEGSSNVALRELFISKPGQTSIITLDNAATGYSFTAPDNSTEYTFTLKTVCSDGGTTYSVAKAKAQPLPDCKIETDVISVTQNTVQIGLAGALSNLAAYVEITLFNKKTGEIIMIQKPIAKPIVIDNLTPNTDYIYYIRASCADGQFITTSNLINFKTNDIVCPIPNILNVVTSRQGEVTSTAQVTWQISPINPNTVFYGTEVRIEKIAGPDISIGLPNPVSQVLGNGVQTFTFSNLNFEGTYKVTVTVACANGGENSTNITFSTKAMVGLIKSNQSGSINVFPNPTKSQMTVDLPEKGFESLTISNIEGKVLSQTSIFTDLTSKTIDCDALPSGLYIITAKGQGKILNSRFVKN